MREKRGRNARLLLKYQRKRASQVFRNRLLFPTVLHRVPRPKNITHWLRMKHHCRQHRYFVRRQATPRRYRPGGLRCKRRAQRRSLVDVLPPSLAYLGMRSEVGLDGFFPGGCQMTIDPRMQIAFFHALTCRAHLRLPSAAFAARIVLVENLRTLRGVVEATERVRYRDRHLQKCVAS